MILPEPSCRSDPGVEVPIPTFPLAKILNIAEVVELNEINDEVGEVEEARISLNFFIVHRVVFKCIL